MSRSYKMLRFLNEMQKAGYTWFKLTKAITNYDIEVKETHRARFGAMPMVVQIALDLDCLACCTNSWGCKIRWFDGIEPGIWYIPEKPKEAPIVTNPYDYIGMAGMGEEW